jgi:hypothetical protein
MRFLLAFLITVVAFAQQPAPQAQPDEKAAPAQAKPDEQAKPAAESRLSSESDSPRT